MTRRLFSKKFHEISTPSCYLLDFGVYLKPNAKTGIFADIFIAPDFLTVDRINKCLPDFPNNYCSGDKLVNTSENIEEDEDRAFFVDSVLVAVKQADDQCVLGALRYSMNVYHARNSKKISFSIDLCGIAVAGMYRRRYIATDLSRACGIYLSEKIGQINKLLKTTSGDVVFNADFMHKGGESAFYEMSHHIKNNNKDYKNLDITEAGGW